MPPRIHPIQILIPDLPPLNRLHLQPRHFPTTRAPVLHPFTVNPPTPFTRVDAPADLLLAVEVGARDVEGVDVGGDDGEEEQDAVHDQVGLRAAEEEHAERGEEDVDAC